MTTADKRELILQAAIHVFARDGVERGKIADIAKKAGVGKGTVYEYFRSKEDILQSIEGAVFSEFQTEFENLLASDQTASAKLEEFFEKGLALMTRMGDAMLILTELWAHSGRWHWHGDDPSYLSQMYDHYREGIRKILHDGVMAGELREMSYDGVASLLLATVDGLAWQFVMLKDSASFETVRREAVKSFMRGIRK